MSLHIGADRRERALKPPDVSEDGQRPARLFSIVRTLSASAALIGMGCIAWAFAIHEWRLALTGATLLIMATVMSAVLLSNHLLADNREFYRRGYLAGWMQGWRGKEPEGDDPLLHR